METNVKINDRTNMKIRITQSLLIGLLVSFLLSCYKINSNSKYEKDLQENLNLSIDSEKTIYPYRAINKNKNWTGDEDTLNLSIKNYDFTIYPGGLLKWGNADSIILSEDMYVTRAFFYVIDTDLLLFCEMSDSDNGTSDMFRINLTNKKIKWKSNLNGFNLSQPAIRTNCAYITVIGSIGKLDLETGKFIYVESNLYDRERTSFNNFDTILFRGNKTIFIAKRPLNSMVDTVIVDEKTKKMTIKKQ
jgi:hypothetical protein